MGLILGALAGAAKGYEAAWDDREKERMAIESDQRRDVSAREQTRFAADVQDQRARAMLLFKQQREDQARADMADRVGAAAGQIADREVGKKRGIIEGAIADREAWTPEQQAAVDQSLALDRQAMVDDQDVRTQAAVQTSDIDPTKAADLDIRGKKAEAAARAGERKEALERDKMSSREKIEQDRMDQRDRIADRNAELQERRIGALVARAGKGENVTSEALKFIEGTRKELADDAANTKALYAAAIKDVSSKRRAEIDEEFKPRLAEIEAKRRRVESDFETLREKVGLSGSTERKADTPASERPKAEPPKAAAKPISTLPDGARQIGTSGGKPVYQLPDGRRIIQQ